MAATTLGTVSNFGIASDETGLLIKSFEREYTADELLMTDKVGEVTGGAWYNERCDVTISGETTTTSPMAEAPGDEITLTNAISYDYLQSASGGRVVVKSISLSRASDQWESLTLNGTLYPYMT